MKAFIFPGQGAQFAGMGEELYQSSEQAQALFAQANEILGFDITEVMRKGSEEDLLQTRITQPAVFLHAIITYLTKVEEADRPQAVAGHSLGEFTALVACGALSFEEALKLVSERALAMQAACEAVEGTMAAIMSRDIELVEKICAEVEEVVVPANYNNPSQLVISGSVEGVAKASEALKEAGAKVIPLKVGGAFHSPLMKMAQDRLQAAIEQTQFNAPFCPIYQNVTASPSQDPEVIKQNLIQQLTGAVRWQQSVEKMIADGMQEFTEVGGRGRILLGMLRKIDRSVGMEMLK
ncbi:ACP S-malonyltransferase [Saprospira grandis]|uniref:ACP S-malonyltransferase n=1 Tax=Saprospira grandis TaxID=1008 RepID=UPI0022DD3A2B|nr:ACP S-malonyltransferase [Saprospira grandis]WBM74865.1 ACP S-malonyltransferase [Saprospira grandis]